MSRKPLGDKAMTTAERQARFRAAHQDGAPRVRYRRPADRRSRPQRWREAVAELVELQAEYQEWLDALPESSLQESATTEALRAICDLDLSDFESVEPPRASVTRNRLITILHCVLVQLCAAYVSSDGKIPEAERPAAPAGLWTGLR